MPIHNLTKQQLSALWQQIQHNRSTRHNTANKRFQMSQWAALGGSARGDPSCHRFGHHFLRKDGECQQRNVAWRCESAPLVAERWRDSSGGSGAGPDAAVVVAWHRDDGEVNAMTIPIQTGTDRPRWSGHFSERCNRTAEVQHLHLRS
jgi:hypothetical protein